MKHEHAHSDEHGHRVREALIVELEAAPAPWELDDGRVVTAWAFNRQVPGPVIEARAGDTLVVRLKNSLSEPTSIHWHGLRVPSPVDGTEDVQRPTMPGETFEYRFTLPDAGTFWYHPHVNETVQLERGLYGALIVRADDGIEVDNERVLVLDDVKLDRKGIAEPGGFFEKHNGREGGTRLLNGRVEPVLEMAAGQVERWRIVNAASARYVRLSVGGRPFRVLATDGGLIEAPVEAIDVLMTPGDRIEIAVGPFQEGETLEIESLPYQRGTGRKGKERFGTVKVGAPAPSRARIPNRLRTIEPLAQRDAAVTREVKLSGRMSLRRGVDFMVNDETHHHAEPVRVGELQVWDIVNVSPMDHPFHLHGFFFQVLAVDGKPPAYRSWEDTINVPAKSRVRIAWLPDDRPGRWMYHCHILEHHAAGMMAHFEVLRPGQAESKLDVEGHHAHRH